MSIRIQVTLLSGRTATVDAGADASVDEVMLQAQSILEVGRGRLVTSSGHVLDGSETITKCGLRSGDVITMHVAPTQVSFSHSAGAAVLGDGSVVTWGKADFAGDSTAVQEKLKNVQQMQASHGAFAAVLADGSVVTWGSASW